MTASRYIGERIKQSYIKHPSGASGNAPSNGWAVDSGTIQILENNLHQLERQRLRPLVSSLGIGTATQFVSGSALFVGFEDIIPSFAAGGFTPGAWQKIPWDRRTAVRFGPFFAVQDFLLDSGLLVQRPISMQLDYTPDAGATERIALFALTQDANPPLTFNAPPAYASVSTAVGQQRVTAKLTLTAPLAVDTGYRCRSAATYANASVDVAVFYLWFGWRVISAGANTFINAFSAWEVDS